MLNQLSSTSCVWTCGCAEKSLFVASTLKIIIITVCLFTWQINEKRGEATFLKSIPFCYWLLVPRFCTWCPVLWHCTSVTGNRKVVPQNRSCVLFEISLNKPHLHLATYRSKQCPNVLCLSSLTYHSDALTCCYTHLCYSHKARVLLNQHIVSRQD